MRMKIITNLPERRLAKHGLKFAPQQLDDYLAKPDQSAKDAKSNKFKSRLTPLYDSTMPPIDIAQARQIVNDPKLFRNLNRGEKLELIRAFMRDDARQLGIDCPESFLTSASMGILKAVNFALLSSIINTGYGVLALAVGLAQEAICPPLRGSFMPDANIATFTHTLMRREFTKHNIPAHENAHALQHVIFDGNQEKLKKISPKHMPDEKTIAALHKSRTFPQNLVYRTNMREVHARAHGREYAQQVFGESNNNSAKQPLHENLATQR